MSDSKVSKPGLADRLALFVIRPWALAAVFSFLVIPSHVLCSGLNSGAAFLKIGTGARPTAMGGAYTAMASDVDAIYYNPSGLASLAKREFGATHAEYLLDTRFDFVGYAQPTTVGTFGLGVTRLASQGFEGRDQGRNTTGGFEASDTAYALSYARGVSRHLKLGGNLKFLQSRIAGYSAETIAFDLGAQHSMSGLPLTMGLSVLNLGRGMKFLDQRDPLPLTLAVGAAYRIMGAVNLAMDVRQEVHDNRFDVGVGTEYAILPSFNLRAGYASHYDGATQGGSGILGGLGGLGAGFGLRMKSYRADYTFTPFGSLGNVQRLSLGASF